jgi:hypothetical protein
MAGAKRANQRTGTAGPGWSLDGTAEDPAADDPAVGEPEWDPDDTEERRVLGQDGENGADPQTRVAQNGVAQVNGSSAAGVNPPGGQIAKSTQKPGIGSKTRATELAPNGETADVSDRTPDDVDGEDLQPEQDDLDEQDPQPEQDDLDGQGAGPEAADWTRDYEAAQRAHQYTGGQQPADFGTPVRLDEIALAAMALSNELHTATQGLPESVGSRQFRRDLDEAVDTFRSVANELEMTAGNLVRLAANESQSCAVTWGVCPEHGLTLMNVGEVVTCHVLGCHRENEGAAERCTQPVAYKVVDAAGPALFTCSGHAIACRLHFEGAIITLASDSLEVL